MKLRNRALTFAFVPALVIVLAGCGSENRDALSAKATTALGPLVQHVRSAAESSNRVGAERALAELRRAVTSYQASGDIGSARAAEILAAAARVASVLPPERTTTTVTTTTKPAPAPRPRDKKGHPPKGD